MTTSSKTEQLASVGCGHFGDRIRHCKLCDQDIVIPHNRVGGYWYLSGWTNPHGLKFWGGYCSPCFRKLDAITSLPDTCANNQDHD